MQDEQKRAMYYDRVRPVVGDFLEKKGIIAYGSSTYPKVVEALLRTGVLRAYVEDEGPIQGGLYTRALGAMALGQNAPSSLGSFSRAHNRFEDRYQIQSAPLISDVLPLKGKVDLLLAYADLAEEALQAARSLQIPAILFSVLEDSRASQAVFVYTPDKDSEDNTRIAARLQSHPSAHPDDSSRYEDFLEAGDLVLAFAKALLVSGTQRERKDLAHLWKEDRSFVIRGSRSWPWETRFLTASQGLKAIESLSSGVVPRAVVPSSLFSRQRVMVLGCGTASLLLAELAHEVSQLILLDAKPFSLFNPIRQICSTDDVEKEEKPFALQKILQRRLPSDESWTEVEENGLRWLKGSKLSIAGERLRLSEMNPESMSRFEKLCDLLQPTLCIVGMGRSRDDNFTACEILRKKGIRHIVPTAFPGVTHFKHIVVDGHRGPCYDCLQNHLPVDGGAGPTLDEEARSVYYGGTQPATLAETYPSAHSLYRISRALMLPEAARPAWWAPLKDEERTSLVGANITEQTSNGWLYGTSLPGQMVAYGPTDVVHSRTGERCACGRLVGKPGG